MSAACAAAAIRNKPAAMPTRMIRSIESPPIKMPSPRPHRGPSDGLVTVSPSARGYLPHLVVIEKPSLRDELQVALCLGDDAGRNADARRCHLRHQFRHPRGELLQEADLLGWLRMR